MKLNSIYSFLDKLLLLKINKTVNYLYEKNFLTSFNQEKDNNYICNLTTVKSKDIPFGYHIYSVKDDTIILQEVINKKEKNLGNKEFSAINIYQCILKAFGFQYFILVILTLLLILFDSFVKYRGIIYFRLLIGDGANKKSFKSLIPGLLMFIFKVTLLLSQTHLKYYGLRIRARVIGAINGVSLLRLSKCNISSDKNENHDLLSKSRISRYQNIITVDSESCESAVSYSIQSFVFPLRLISGFTVAAVTFDTQTLKLLIILLSTLFTCAIISLFISTLFKKPFIAHREERLAETANIIENSRYLILTQDHLLSSFHNLLSNSRKQEMYYGSFRKYFFAFEEILSRSMGYICYGVISLYVWYNHVNITKSIEMIVNAAWLVPSFYVPLQELCYLIYYISEGINALSRFSKLIQLTKIDSIDINKDHNYNNSITIEKDHSIIININDNINKDFNLKSITLNYGEPILLLSSDISSNKFLSNKLKDIIFGNNIKNNINIELNKKEKKCFILDKLTCINNPICYVPSDAWITDSMNLLDIILNGREYNDNDWNKVIEICELKKDFLNWNINNYESAKSTIFSQLQFSRGQKIRLSLARALYGINSESNSILILDSIFDNLDPPVSSSILSKLFNNKDGILNNLFSILILDIHMIKCLPYDIIQSNFYILPSENKLINSNIKDISQLTINSLNINSIINNNFSEDDFSNYLWRKVSNNNNNLDFDIVTCKSSNYLKEEEIYSFKENDNLKVELFNNNIKFDNIKENSELCKELFKNNDKENNIENSYNTYLYYILRAANRYKYPNNWNGITTVKESSLEMILYLILLISPQLILTFGEKILLGSLGSENMIKKDDVNVNFWYFTYFLCVIMAILSVITSNYLEVFTGLRAARNIHNTFLLGYISSKLSSKIRSLPISFILNRLSMDQLTIDYCTTKRLGQFTTAINRIMSSVYLSLAASEYPYIHMILFILFGILLYKYILRYFINSCRLLHNTYISEISPLIDIIRNICDGKEYLQPQKLDNFYLENGYKQLQEVMKPVYIQSSLEIWLKLRLQVGIIIPVTFLNLISSYISGSNSKALIALVIATTYSSLPRIDEIVRYWIKLERELVSVERMRKYIQIIKDEYFSQKQCNDENLDILIDYNKNFINNDLSLNMNNSIVLESVCGYHSSIFSGKGIQMDRSEIKGIMIKKTCFLKDINAKANKGDIIGIIGRSGSGKTSLLCLIARSLSYEGNIKHSFSLNKNDNLRIHLIDCNLCKFNTDQHIMNMFIDNYNKMRYIAMLPIEVFFNKQATLRSSLDPFNRYRTEDIVFALDVCGISEFILQEFNIQHKYNIDQVDIYEDSLLIKKNDFSGSLSDILDTELVKLSLPMSVKRMLLFAHFFLKRDEINILLIDEPPVISYKNIKLDPNYFNDEFKNTSLILNVISKYFAHSITFIVSHDVRNLNGIKKFWHLNQGSLMINEI